ncbi:MAG: SRPBCC family protein [Sandaracinaceae bacterium]|nr:SRPBCC family protein [Sandaracinaceae bacterium]
MLLPVLILMEGVAPPPADTHMVETVVEVAAPPEVVWERVVAFPELPPIEDWIFRVGVAAPTGARIEGSGVGAIRRCEFTTGEFVEPIEVWDPPRELGFSVQDMPDPMREMSPYDIRPRHLDGYFRTTAGQFLLERTATGGTRLRGRTYYQLDMMPTVYGSCGPTTSSTASTCACCGTWRTWPRPTSRTPWRPNEKATACGGQSCGANCVEPKKSP